MSQSNKENTKPKTLVKKLVEVFHDIGVVPKAKRNPHFGYNYISEGQMNAVIGPKLAERGILFTTSVETMDVKYGEPKAGVFVSVTTLHTFRDAETGEELSVKGAGVGWDTGDKGVYKAITGATKYALMKNFMVTDEQEPEGGTQHPEAAPAGAKGHKRTRPYEEETGEGDQKATTDMLELKSFLTENKIPEGFLLRMLQDKALIDGHTKAVGQIKPGIVSRILSPKSKENLLKAWKAHLADEESGSATPPKNVVNLPANKGDGEVIRTKEGDQTVSYSRSPIQSDVELADVLAQDGYDNWREVPIHFGKQKATTLGKLTAKSLQWWIANYKPEQYKGTWNDKDILLDAALVLASMELAGGNE
jgi:hypothetical protein